MDEIRRKVLTLLNIPTETVQGYSREIGGRVIEKASHVVPMTVPTLDALMLKLVEAMTNKNQPYLLSIGQDMGGTDKWLCRLQNLHDASYSELASGISIPHAIAALFLAAVEAGLVDPTTVRL